MVRYNDVPLLLSAAPFEVQPTLQLCTDAGAPVDYHSIGVGSLAAAKSCPTLTSLAQDRHVVLIGTAGVFGPFHHIEVVTTTEVHWLPTSDRTGQSYSIKGVCPPLYLRPSSVVTGARRLEQCVTVCSPSISCTPSFEKSVLKQANLDQRKGRRLIENLELYSIAEELDTVAKDFTILLAITNEIGAEAHRQWKNNFARAAELTAKTYADLFLQQEQ